VETLSEIRRREQEERLRSRDSEFLKKEIKSLLNILRDPETELLSVSTLRSLSDSALTPILEFRLRLAFRPEGTTPEDSTKREEEGENELFS